MTTAILNTERTNSAAAQSRTTAALAAGSVNTLLRLEGLAALAAALAGYWHAGFSWAAFALLFLTPDLAMLGYLGGPRVGAAIYNLAHTYALAGAAVLAGFLGGLPFVAAVSLIWIAHIGFDRALGYGLKFPAGFADTHLGRIGRR
jgi:hypothetical protein